VASPRSHLHLGGEDEQTARMRSVFVSRTDRSVMSQRVPSYTAIHSLFDDLPPAKLIDTIAQTLLFRVTRMTEPAGRWKSRKMRTVVVRQARRIDVHDTR